MRTVTMNDAHPFETPPRPAPGWSIAADGGTDPAAATATAERFRSHGREAHVWRYLARTLSGVPFVAYRVLVDIPPTDAAWAAYRGE